MNEKLVAVDKRRKLAASATVIASNLMQPKHSRRTALVSLAPVCCCCGCGRNQLLDKFFASAMATGMKEYEAAIAPVKRQLWLDCFASGDLSHTTTVLELGIGTGPNLQFYPPSSDLKVIGKHVRQFWATLLLSSHNLPDRLSRRNQGFS